MSCGGNVIVEPVTLSSTPYILCYDEDNDHFFKRDNLDRIMGYIHCYDVKKLDSFLEKEHSAVYDIKLFDHVLLYNSLEALYRVEFGDEAWALEQKKERIAAAYRAARATGVEPDKENYSWLFDQEMVEEYHKERLKAIAKLANKLKIDFETYDFKLKFSRALHEIEKNKIYVEGELTHKIKKHVKDSFVSSVFNFHSETTWRIGIESGFNPMNLKKGGEERKCIKSRYGKDGEIVVLDYNAMDFRSLFHMFPDLFELAKEFEGQDDFHEHGAFLINKIRDKNLVSCDRNKFKAMFFPLIYGSREDSREYGVVFKDFFDKQREIGSAELALRAQTFSAKIFGEALIKVVELLKNKQSKIIFTVHDCVVLDFHRSEEDLLPKLKELLENPCPKYKYKVKTKRGNDYGEASR